MDTNRVNIFHITYGNAVSRTVPHYLILDFLPACDTALYQNLTHSGKSESVFQNFLQFHLIMGNTAAGAAPGLLRCKDPQTAL